MVRLAIFNEIIHYLLHSRVDKAESYLISGYHNEWIELTYYIETLYMTKTFFHECIFTFFSSNTNIIVFCSQLHIWPIIWVGCAWYSSEKLITVWIRSTCTWTFNLRNFYFPCSASCNGKSQSRRSCWPCIFKVYWKRNLLSFSWNDQFEYLQIFVTRL